MRDRQFVRIRFACLAFVILAAAGAVVGVTPAAASCYPVSLVDAVGGADVAVVGTVQAIEPDGYDLSHDVALAWGHPLDRVTLEVERIVAGDESISADAEGLVLDVATFGEMSSEHLGLEVGERRALLLYRQWGALFAHDACLDASPEEMLAVEVDLPEPTAVGPVELVTAGWRHGPSDVQLRDRRGNVVAWGRVGAEEDRTWLCPDGRVVVVGSRDVLDGSRDRLVATDLLSHDRHTIDVEDAHGLRGPIEECATPDGSALVAIDHDSGLVQLVTRSAEGTAQVAELASLPTPIHAWSRVVGDSIAVARTGAVHLIDIDSGSVRDLAVLPPTARPRFAEVGLDSRVAVVIADGADHEVLLIDATGNVTRGDLEVPGEVVAMQLVPGGVLIGQHATGFHDESGRIVHLDDTGTLVATLVLREVPELGYSTSDRLWVGIDADGSLELVEPGADGPEHVVPFTIYSTAAFVPQFAVPGDVRALHTSEQLRALAPGGANAPPVASTPEPQPIDDAGGRAVAAIFVAAGGGLALIALVGVVLSRRRRPARPRVQP